LPLSVTVAGKAAAEATGVNAGATGVPPGLALGAPEGLRPGWSEPSRTLELALFGDHAG
jgi:hypothetical protein